MLNNIAAYRYQNIINFTIVRGVQAHISPRLMKYMVRIYDVDHQQTYCPKKSVKMRKYRMLRRDDMATNSLVSPFRLIAFATLIGTQSYRHHLDDNRLFLAAKTHGPIDPAPKSPSVHQKT